MILTPFELQLVCRGGGALIIAFGCAASGAGFFATVIGVMVWQLILDL